MGMDAELLAIGKFEEGLVEHLDYPKDFYGDTPVGSEIITRVFSCNTTDASKDLAIALGIGPWAFETHKVNLDKIDYNDLKFFIEEHLMEEEYEDFLALRDAGFTFWYRPNG